MCGIAYVQLILVSRVQVHSTSVPGRPTTVRGGQAWSHKVPSRVDANEPVGHLINDGASISMASFLDPATVTIPQMIEAYYNQSFARSDPTHSLP